MRKIPFLLAIMASACFHPIQAASLNANDPVKLTLVNDVRSGRSKKGTEVEFVVSENVTNHRGEVLIKKGTSARGMVVNSRHAGALGRRGVLEVDIKWTTTADGQNVPLRASAEKKGPAIKRYVHLGA